MEHDNVTVEENLAQRKQSEVTGGIIKNRKDAAAADDDDELPAEKRMRPNEFADYEELLDELADQLKIVRHPNSLVLLRAARLLMEANCLSSSSSSSSSSTNNAPQQSTGTSESVVKSARQQDDTEIRIQQSKFSLADVILPRSLIKSATNNLGNRQQQASDCGDGGGGDSDNNNKSATQRVPISGGSLSSSSEKRSITSTTTTTITTTTTMEKDELVGVFERAAKALKLLYLDDQRQLQNQVNELISCIQSITANPKTDPRLLLGSGGGGTATGRHL